MMKPLMNFLSGLVMLVVGGSMFLKKITVTSGGNGYLGETLAMLFGNNGVSEKGVTGIMLVLIFTMLILAFIFEEPCLPQSTGCWISVCFLAIFCTGIAYIAQAVAQQYTTATHVGIIFTLEPVFAGIVAFLFAGERLLPRAYFGAFLMIISILLIEIDPKAIKDTKSK